MTNVYLELHFTLLYVCDRLSNCHGLRFCTRTCPLRHLIHASTPYTVSTAITPWLTLNSTVRCKSHRSSYLYHSALLDRHLIHPYTSTADMDQRPPPPPQPPRHQAQPPSHHLPRPRPDRRPPLLCRPAARNPPLPQVQPRLPSLRLQPRRRQLPFAVEQRVRSPARRRHRSQRARAQARGRRQRSVRCLPRAVLRGRGWERVFLGLGRWIRGRYSSEEGCVSRINCIGLMLAC